MSAEQLERFAAARLRELLDHCLREVPFYGERLRALSDDPEVLAGPAFEQIPPLRKSEIASAGAALLTSRGRDTESELTQITSGGTTGPPTRLLLDRDTVDAHAAATLRSFVWIGADPTRRHVLLWGPPPDENSYGFLAGRLKGLVLRRTLLPTYGFDDALARHYWEKLCRWKLNFVSGYSSALVRVARMARPGERCRISAGVIPAAEPLYDFQRQRLEEAFGVPLRERYGSNEFAMMAQQCCASGLHVAVDRVRIEILREDGTPTAPGEVGRVLVTDLDNLTMPLLRYQIGDLAAWGKPCSCGLPFPLLERVHGREGDALPAPNGGIQSPHAFAAALQGTPARALQLVVDKSRRLLEIRLEGAPFPLDGVMEHWRSLVERPDFKVRFVDEIQRSASGKILPVVQLES